MKIPSLLFWNVLCRVVPILKIKINPCKKILNALVIIIVLLPQQNTFGQDSIRVAINETYVITKLGYVQKSQIQIPIPKDYLNRQKVSKIKYSESPAYIAKNENSYYAVYELSETDLNRISKITLSYQLVIYDYDLLKATLKTETPTLKDNVRKRYLKKTDLYKLQAQTIDTSLINKELEKKEIALKIHDFVANHLSYQTNFGEDKGAQFALNNRKGDCTEYADLMIALCRYNDIPARRVSGFAINWDTSSLLGKIFRSSGHAWVELYFEKLGWVPFDPTHSNNTSPYNFFNLQTKYVYLNFSDMEKSMNWKYWGYGDFRITLERTINLVN